MSWKEAQPASLPAVTPDEQHPQATSSSSLLSQSFQYRSPPKFPSSLPSPSLPTNISFSPQSRAFIPPVTAIELFSPPSGYRYQSPLLPGSYPQSPRFKTSAQFDVNSTPTQFSASPPGMPSFSVKLPSSYTSTPLIPAMATMSLDSRSGYQTRPSSRMFASGNLTSNIGVTSPVSLLTRLPDDVLLGPLIDHIRLCSHGYVSRKCPFDSGNCAKISRRKMASLVFSCGRLHNLLVPMLVEDVSFGVHADRNLRLFVDAFGLRVGLLRAIRRCCVSYFDTYTSMGDGSNPVAGFDADGRCVRPYFSIASNLLVAIIPRLADLTLRVNASRIDTLRALERVFLVGSCPETFKLDFAYLHVGAGAEGLMHVLHQFIGASKTVRKVSLTFRADRGRRLFERMFMSALSHVTSLEEVWMCCRALGENNSYENASITNQPHPSVFVPHAAVFPENAVEIQPLQTLADLLSNNPKLERIHWGPMEFTTASATSIPVLQSALESHSCASIRILDLSNLQLRNAGTSAFCGGVLAGPMLHSLEQLRLANAGIGNEGAEALSMLVERSNCLRWLDVARNEIGDGGALRLGWAAGNRSSPIGLGLTGNSFGDAALRQIGNTVMGRTSGFSELHVMSLKQSTPAGLLSLIMGLMGSEELCELSLDGGLLVDEVQEALASALPGWTSLRKLRVGVDIPTLVQKFHFAVNEFKSQDKRFVFEIASDSADSERRLF
ncbi:hypothetical protein BJ742DRAFT_838537 [Cladochytrium replicatum]|nr:hypothetical protein BJ742DRAFT_838537 [Cladochytrium replicatum]